MQQLSYKDVLYQILTIIEYQNNKEKFTEEFETLNRLDAMAEIVKKLPQELQEQIKISQSPEDLQHLINLTEYKDVYGQVSQKALEEFISSIVPQLSVTKKEKIVSLFNTLT